MKKTDTNPKLTFYSLLNAFLSAPECIDMVAERLVELRKTLGDSCTFLYYSKDEWIQSHEDLRESDHRSDETALILDCFLADMHSQMRSEVVQDLLWKFQNTLGYTESLFVYTHKVRPLGGRMAMVSMFVNDWSVFQKAIGRGAYALIDMQGVQVTDCKEPDTVFFGHCIKPK